MLSPGFFLLREQGDIPEADIHFDFDNVTFVLNVLDSLAGSDRLPRDPQAPPRPPHA